MKEPPAALLLRHEIDRPACASSASSESGSLELLLTLHALVGATICGAQTDAAAQVERVARRNRRFHGGMLTPCGRAAVKVAQVRSFIFAPKSYSPTCATLRIDTGYMLY